MLPRMAQAPAVQWPYAITDHAVLRSGTGGSLWLLDRSTEYNALYYKLGARYKNGAHAWAWPSHIASLAALLEYRQVQAGDSIAEAELARARQVREQVLALQLDRDWASVAGDPRLDPYQRAGVLFLRTLGRALLADEAGAGKCVLPTTPVWTSLGPIPIQALWTQAYAWVTPNSLAVNQDGSIAARPRYQGIRVSTLVQAGAQVIPTQGSFQNNQIAGSAGQIGYAQLWKAIKKPVVDQTLYQVYAGGSSITCTAEHQFWTLNGWEPASALSIGQVVALHPAVHTGGPGVGVPAPIAEGPAWAPITEIISSQYTGDLYDLEVPGSNSYVAAGFVVHNSGQALLAVTQEPALIICPKSVQGHWRNEIRKWLGTEKPEWQITNWAQLSREHIPEGSFGTLILDEVQYAVNRHAKRSAVAAQLAEQIPHVFALSGTPIRNSLTDLWHILHMLDSERWSSYWSFAESYCNVQQGRYGKEILAPDPSNEIGAAKLAMLQKAIYPYVLRRTIDSVIALPPKNFIELESDLLPVQRKIYRQLLDELVSVLEDEEGRFELFTPNALSKLMRLRQCCLWPGLFGASAASARDRQVVELLQDLCGEQGEQVVIFSQFAGYVKHLVQLPEVTKLSPALIIGEASSNQREAARSAFLSGQARVLLGTHGALGVGVDGLQQASRSVLFTDSAWTFTDNDQAEDRLRRRGQARAVQVYRLSAPETVEPYVWGTAAAKGEIADNTFAMQQVLRKLLEQARSERVKTA